MAERTRRFRPQGLLPGPACLLALSLLLCPGLPAAAAETSWSTGLGFALEYSDNIENTGHNQKTDIITHIKPNFEFLRESGRFSAQVKYRGDYQYHGRGKDADDYSHYLNAWALGEIVENLFFLRVEEDLQPVNLNPTEGETLEGDNTRDFVNRNRITVAPTLTLHPSERTSVSAGYTFVDTRHSKSDSSGARRKPFPNGGDEYSFNHKKSQTHTLNGQVSHEVSERFSVLAGGDLTRRTSDSEAAETEGADLYRYQAYAGFSYEASEDLFLQLKAGPSYTKPDHKSGALNTFMQGELRYTIGRTAFTLSYDTTYEDDAETGDSLRHTTYGAKVDREFDRARFGLGLSYNTYDDENTDGSLKNIEVVRPAASFSYDLSPRLRFFSFYNSNIYTDKADGTITHTLRYGLRYELDEASWLSLTHRYKQSAPYDSVNYAENSVTVEIFYAF